MATSPALDTFTAPWSEDLDLNLCEECDGTGLLHDRKCKKCDGKGQNEAG